MDADPTHLTRRHGDVHDEREGWAATEESEGGSRAAVVGMRGPRMATAPTEGARGVTAKDDAVRQREPLEVAARRNALPAADMNVILRREDAPTMSLDPDDDALAMLLQHPPLVRGGRGGPSDHYERKVVENPK